MKTTRTRIAPSPTGEDLHIGNAYTALINYVFANKQGGQFIIRIEDTDRTRFVEGSEARILASLGWLGISHDEGPDKSGPYAPYRQSERLPVYKEHAERLITEGHAYYCFCTPQRLDEMRKVQEANRMPPMYDGLCKTIPHEIARQRVAAGEKHVIRLLVPDTGATTFTDLIRGDITIENRLVDDQVLLKSDGFPTYHLGVVVDDHLMGITHIIRGEEWISSTPKHVLLYQFFGWELPQFAHMPVIRNPDKSKLSKRKNPVWVSMYKQQGFLPEAVLNYLSTLAWANPEGKEQYTLEEMMSVFELSQIQTSAPIFDVEKLKWMNKQYLMKKTPQEFYLLVRDISVYRDHPQFAHIIEITAPLIQPRISTLSEFDPMISFFFEQPKEFHHPVAEQTKAILKTALSGVEWNHDAMEQAIRQQAEAHSIKAKDLFMDLRVAITGKIVGPPLLESIEILGKEETLSRL